MSGDNNMELGAAFSTKETWVRNYTDGVNVDIQYFRKQRNMTGYFMEQVISKMSIVIYCIAFCIYFLFF